MTDTKKHPIHNAVRLVGETRLPGASLLLDGEVTQGAARMVIGVAARALIGPAGWLLVAADSYTKSTTGKGIAERVIGMFKSDSKSDSKAQESPVAAEAAAQ